MDLRGKTYKESSRGENIHVLRTGEPALIHAWELESLLINKFYNNPDFFNVFFFPTMAQAVKAFILHPPCVPLFATLPFPLWLPVSSCYVKAQ